MTTYVISTLFKLDLLSYSVQFYRYYLEVHLNAIYNFRPYYTEYAYALGLHYVYLSIIDAIYARNGRCLP
jgi:hypothetical protein